MSRFARPLAVLAALSFACVLPAVPAQAASSAGSAGSAGSPQPRTIPALRSWTPAGSGFQYSAGSRIVAESASLNQTAGTLADDLASLTGQRPKIASGPARSGDIALALGATDARLGAEGYALTVGPTLRIAARTDAGAFYGTRSVLQMLHQSRTIRGGHAVDWPETAQRGLMVDVGRKFYTVAWLRDHIRDLAYQKLNYLHLHLSDNLGFRLESSTHPEIVSRDHYTKKDIRELVALGQRYHVTIVPEIDMPGHMDTILAAHPDLRLRSAAGVVSKSMDRMSRANANAPVTPMSDPASASQRLSTTTDTMTRAG